MPVECDVRLFSLRHLSALTRLEPTALVALSQVAGGNYEAFDTRPLPTHLVPNPKWRHIDNPNRNLKSVQRVVHRKVLIRARLPRHMYGAVKGGSVLDHAGLHVGQECVGTLDLRDCFPRTSNIAVYDALCSAYHCSGEIAALLTRLTTIARRLPQGSPTSGFLAHLVLVPLFDDMSALADRLHLRLSFYMDDVAFSGRERDVRRAMQPMIELLQKHGYSIRARKRHLMASNDEKVVTNLVVTADHIELTNEYAARVREDLLEAINAGVLTEHRLQSLCGRMAWIRTVHPEQLDVIDELFEYLPAPSPGGRKRKTERSRCRSRRACLAQRWSIPGARPNALELGATT